MLYTINDLPKDARPRERLMKNGASSLADYELLAIILRTGTKKMSALDLAKCVLTHFGDLDSFNDLTITELKQIEGIKDAKAIEILAAIEFGRRVCSFNKERKCLKDRRTAYNYVRYDLENLKHEELRVYYLDVRGQVIDYKITSTGGANSTSGDFKEVLKWAFKLSSSYLLLVHNHPSGNPEPSDGDIIFTRNIIQYCKNLDIMIIDHLIIGKNSYYSFDERKIFLA